ncbi:hypothetical protein GCM10009780_70670 [Actinomadura alba]
MCTVVLAMAAGGCGGSGPSPTASPSAPSTMSSEPPASATAGPDAAVDVAAAGRAYVDAVNEEDLAGLAEAFTTDAEIVDVSRSIRGRAAIRDWAAAEVIGGRLRVLRITPMPGGQDLLVHWAPSGSAGWRAHYRFTYRDGAIARADLQYA